MRQLAEYLPLDFLSKFKLILTCMHATGQKSSALQVTGKGLQSLGQLQELVRLELVSTNVFEAKDLAPLSSLCHLRHLDIGNVMYITKAVLQVGFCSQQIQALV